MCRDVFHTCCACVPDSCISGSLIEYIFPPREKSIQIAASPFMSRRYFQVEKYIAQEHSPVAKKFSSLLPMCSFSSRDPKNLWSLLVNTAVQESMLTCSYLLCLRFCTDWISKCIIFFNFYLNILQKGQS